MMSGALNCKEGPAQLRATLPDVSRETVERLQIYADLLRRWQERINLIGPATQREIWTRHFIDSLQLRQLAPVARQWVDLGSGAGFPGLVIALSLEEGCRVRLVESNGKKCAFLREVIRATGARALVIQDRIEAIAPALAQSQIDVVTARALAPLPILLQLAEPMLKTGSVGLFLKGQDVATELTQTQQWWSLQHRLHPSISSHDGCILEISRIEAQPRKSSHAAELGE